MDPWLWFRPGTYGMVSWMGTFIFFYYGTLLNVPFSFISLGTVPGLWFRPGTPER
jgi:hypothetical protein